MFFVEQLRLLSLLPRSWSYEKTMELFDCSRHAIKIAHRMYHEQQYLLKRDSEPSIRQQADHEKVKHFVNWLGLSKVTLLSQVIYRTLLITAKIFVFVNISLLNLQELMILLFYVWIMRTSMSYPSKFFNYKNLMFLLTTRSIVMKLIFKV